jgi:hypothetical protein
MDFNGSVRLAFESQNDAHTRLQPDGVGVVTKGLYERVFRSGPIALKHGVNGTTERLKKRLFLMLILLMVEARDKPAQAKQHG